MLRPGAFGSMVSKFATDLELRLLVSSGPSVYPMDVS